MEINRFFKLLIPVLTIFPAVLGCGKAVDSISLNRANVSLSNRTLYVASGSCYAGGVAVTTGTGTVSAFDTDGRFLRVVADYTTFSPGDRPVGIEEYDKDHLLVAVENTAGRRIDLVSKYGQQVQTFISSAAALPAAGAGIVRGLIKLTDGSMLVNKSVAIEKFSVSKARVPSGASYINAPAAPCATSTTLISSLATLPNGKILFTHAAATPNNKIGIISASGYTTAADCLAGTAAPVTTALPTSIVVHSSGRLLVAYGSTVATSNFIYSYDINPTTNVISNATLAFSDISTIYGPSAMVEDPSDASIYVSNGSLNTIEKFEYNPITRLLTKSTGSTFITPNIYSQCVTSMKVLGDQ